MHELAEHAPQIVFAFVNICLVIGEVRVFDVAYRLMNVWWMALAASLSTGVPFFLWEIALLYKLASSWQRLLAGLMAACAFIAAMWIGTQDLLSAWAGTANIPGATILTTLGVLFALHIVAGIFYYYGDPEIAQKRMTARLDALYAFRAKKLTLATQYANKEKDYQQALIELDKVHTKATAAKVRAQLRLSGGEEEAAPVQTTTKDDGLMERLKELVPMFQAERANGNGVHPPK